MADNILRKNQTGEPTVNGGQFASKQHTEADTCLSVGSVYADVSETVDEFLFGSVADLTLEQVDTLDRLTHHMPVIPNVAVHSTDRVDLIYNLPGTAATDPRTVRLTMNSGGRIIGAGDGDYWEDNNSEQDDYLRLRDAGFGE